MVKQGRGGLKKATTLYVANFVKQLWLVETRIRKSYLLPVRFE